MDKNKVSRTRFRYLNAHSAYSNCFAAMGPIFPSSSFLREAAIAQEYDRDYSSKVVAAITIAGPTFRFTEDKLPLLARSVIAVAQELSADLGYNEAAINKGPTTVCDAVQLTA